jgi:hypothetical protein
MLNSIFAEEVFQGLFIFIYFLNVFIFRVSIVIAIGLQWMQWVREFGI